MRFVLYLALALWGASLSAQESYNLQPNADITINACSGTLYDSGGPEGDYQEETSVAVISAPEADFFELTFTEFAIEANFDQLLIYAGNPQTGTLVGSYDGFDLPNNGQVIQVAASEVTIIFYADFSIEYAGFALSFACGNIDTPPVADFSGPANTCSGSVAFTDQSTGFATSWTWDFGDGNTSSAQNPQHQYATPGTYDVSLTSCNSAGCNTVTVTDAITYDPDTEICTSGITMPAFGEDSSTACQGILFDPGGPDDDYPANAHGQFLIAPAGASSITLTFTEFNLGDDGEHTDILYLYDPINFMTLGVYQGSSLPNNGQPLSFDVASVFVVFSSNATNNFSGFALEWTANGSTEAPVAGYTVSDDNPGLGIPVQFTDTSTNGPGQWFWDFGDGNSSTLQNPAHIYSTPGTYTVSLTVTNCIGSDIIATQTITVQEAPALTYDPESYNVTLTAGTTETAPLTLCNVGLGDLFVGSSVLGGAGSTTGALNFQLTTNENGADFSWELQDINFQTIQSGDEYGAFETLSLNFTNLELFQEYYLVLNSPEGVQALDDFTWLDPDGNILFSGMLATGPEMTYILPTPFEVPAASWLGISDGDSELAPDACNELTVTFDATELIGGLYESSIILTSNDPDQPSVTIPVTMTVIGTPAIGISTNNLDFGETQIGATPSLSFTIENTGTDVLTVGNLNSAEAAFQLSDGPDLTLNPGQSRTVEVTFAPTAIQDYSTILSLSNNAGDDQLVSITGSGIAAPSLTVDPLSFSQELVAGETATFVVNVGNVGEAPLTYNASVGGDAVGFIFEFTTDNWGGEFSWTLFDADANPVLSSEGAFYAAFTTYTETLVGLNSDEEYTLWFYDTFADGSLTDFSVTDIGSGTVVASGDFMDSTPSMMVALGSPQEVNTTITPDSGTLTTGNSEALSIFFDTEGWNTGTYNFLINLATNDPLQPNVPISVTLFVIAPVEVDFSASPTTVCGNLPVQFTDLTENVATSWAWDFGDGTTSEEQNPSHLYTTDGSYTVSLTACNSLGCETVTKTDYISVETDCYTQNIPAGHVTETITVCSGNVYDSGGPTGDYLEGNFGVLVIAPPGAEQVSITFTEFNYEEHADFLYVYDGDPNTGNSVLLGIYTGNELAGQTLVATSGVLVLQEFTGHFTELSGFAATFFCDADPQPPVANFNPNDDALCFGEARLFNDLSAGNIDTWLWEFGDGSTSQQQNPAYVYLSSGVYTVSLTVCNEEGCDTYVEDVVIEINTDCNIEDIPENEVTYITNCAGQIFDSGGADENYLNNNNGVTTLIRPGGGISLTFTEFDFASDDYLALVEGEGLNGNILAFYTAENPPVLNETISINGEIVSVVEITDGENTASGFRLEYTCPAFSPEEGSALQVINDDLCDGLRTFRTNPNLNYDSWSWNFGDGHTSTAAEPTHTYVEPGMYAVTVEACDNGDCDSYAIMLYSNKLIPQIEAPDAVLVGEEVHFHGMTETATHWNWDFGNGQTVTDHTPSTVYNQAGEYEVNVHLMNMNIHETCDASMTHTITVSPATTSVDEALEVSINVFPNPATERVFLRWDTNVDELTSIRVYDQRGRLVLQSPPASELDFGPLAAGNYVVELRFAEHSPQRHRVVKQ